VEGRAAVFAVRKDFDIVVTNAGGPPPGDFRDWDRDAWIKAVDANMLTPIELIKATVDGMAARGFGRIVNITSSAVKSPIDILGLSNGARSGLTGFVAGVARSKLAAQGVTHQQPAAGAFDTDRLRGNFNNVAQKSGQPLDAVMDARRKAIPAQRFGTPEEFGASALPVQRAGRLHDGAERAGRRRGLSGHLLSIEHRAPARMSLRYLSFRPCRGHRRHRHAGSRGLHLARAGAAVHAEIVRVLDWAHAEFPGRRGPLDEGFDWDYDLQGLLEYTAPQVLHYDEAAHACRAMPARPEGRGIRSRFRSADCPDFAMRSCRNSP
jgi:NAD(P)-dependent dehydrogenase (short-subunit alcohol dehydrogenase family)